MPDGSKSDEVIFLELVSASSASKDDKESSNEAHVRSRKMSEEILSTQVSEEDHSRQPSEEILSRKAAKGILHRKASEEIPSSDGYTESISSGGIFDIVEEENVQAYKGIALTNSTNTVSVLPFGGFPLVRRILEKAGVTFENSKDLTSAEDQAESVETYKVKAVFLKCTNKYITTDGQPDTIYKLRFQKCLEDGSYSANLRSNTSTREPNELEDWVPDLNFERSRPPASGEGRCEVERILSTERSGENLWCFIKWVGYPLEESSWELITDVDSGQLMDQYRKRCFALMALAKRYDHTVPERDEKYFKSPEHRRLALFERQVNTMCAKYNQAPLFVENWVTKESKPAKYEYTLENTFSMKAKCLLEEYKAREPCHCEECPTEEKCCCGKDFHYKQDGIKLSQLHRTYTFIECSSACRCYGTGGKCRNRILQYGRQIPLILFRTRRKGWGIFAAERITKGTFICEYVGHIMLYSEAKERQQPRYAYDLGPEAEMTIVAEHRGNESRFVNHSCEPNLEVRSIVVDFEDCPIYRRLGYFATSDIEPGEELTIDYFPQTAKPEKKGKSKRSRRRSTNPCLCEADNCRGQANMNRQRSDFIIRFDPKLFNQLSKLKDDFWFDVQQQSGFSTIPGHVPTVRKNMINVRTNMNLLEGYSSASAKMKIDRTRGILQMFQLSLIGMNGGAAKIMEQGGFSRSNLFDCGFMASRASLVRIGMRLLDHRDELNLVAVRRKGIIFLHEIPTPENYGSALENEYVGHRFRQIMTIPSDEDPRRVTSFEDEHFGIQKLTFGNINVLCRSVVDCITDEISYEYIELKTHRDKSAGSPFNVGWMKSIRWWLQMTLTGVKNVVVGVRDVDNILRETLFATSESFLPSDFNKMAVLVFIERCLARIEDCMVKIPEGKAMRFHSPRHSSGLVAVASDHDYNMFHPIFEKLLAH